MVLKVCDVVGNFQIGDIIIIASNHKHKCWSDNELDHKSICLTLFYQCLPSPGKPWVWEPLILKTLLDLELQYQIASNCKKSKL